MTRKMMPMAVLGCLVLAPLAWAASAGADGPETDPGGRMEHAIRAYLDLHGITGAAIGVRRGDEIVYSQTFGDANVELRTPVRRDTLFQLSSTTKVFTGTLVTVLAQQGLVDFGQPLRHYLPQLPASWGDVLVVDAMSHVSGLPEVLECEEKDDRDRALACVFGMERPMPRREKFVYNQTNYLLAMMLVETVTGTSFADALQKYVLAPAGMTGVVIDGNNLHVVPLRATSYYPDDTGGLRIRDYDFPWFLSTAAGLNVSLDDMLRFAAALGDGTLLTDDWKARMWQVPQLSDGSPSNYSVGWDNRRINHGLDSVGHNGGNLTTFRVYPSAGLSVAVLTNGVRHFFDLDELADVLAMTLEPDILVPRRTLAYRAKLAYADDGVDAALRVVVDGFAVPELEPADRAWLVGWLADDLVGTGHAEDGARVLRFGIEHLQDPTELESRLDELRRGR